MENANRNIVITLRVSEKEKYFIEEKTKMSGSSSMSSYIRKMAISGIVVKYESKEIKKIRKSLGGIQKNINQMAIRVNYRDVTLKSDFAVYEENIYVDGDFYVNEPTTLHCDVYNRNLVGGWADIIVKDGEEVIYSAEDKWLGKMSTEKIEIPWTPKTKDSKISVTLTNKSQFTKEFSTDNNFAERQLTAIEYQVPELSDIQSTLALENRSFALSADIRNIKNLTDVKMYLDGTEITDLQSSLSKDINKYWYNCTGLKAGSHTVKLLATYEKAGGNFDIAEKSLTFEVISASKSSAIVAKNTSATNTNTSADIYNGTNYVATYTPDETGKITIPFTTSMYNQTSSYKIVVNTTKGMWISELKAGTLKVNNSNVQNTFNVKGLNSVRYANLYAKSADSEYYQQVSYKTLYKSGMSVVYFDSNLYAQFSKAKDAYLLVVTNDNKMYQLWIIKDGVRITDSNGSITMSEENRYQSLLSSPKATATLAANTAEDSSVTTLKSSWNTSYQGKADIAVSSFGSEILHKPYTNGKTVELPYNDYVVDYTLQSDNYVFEVEKAMTLNSENVTNRIENSFSGKISMEESAEVKSDIALNVYDMVDKNGNQLKYVSAINNRPITVTVIFTDTKDSSNVIKKTVSFNNFDGSIADVTVPEKAGEYKVSISMALITETTRLGDLNSDGKINGTDVALMKKFVYGVQTPTAKQKLVADMDKSGEIDKKDLNLLKSML